jgi:hypothetical protein
MPGQLDLPKLIRLLGMTGSDHVGEAGVAAQKANQMLRAAGMTWDELFERQTKLLDAAKQLVAERDAALAEAERLKRSGGAINGNTNALAQALWRDTGSPTTVSSKHARWVLDLDEIYLSPRESEFVEKCAHWRGPLTPPMAAWLQDIVRRAANTTGQTPP